MGRSMFHESRFAGSSFPLDLEEAVVGGYKFGIHPSLVLGCLW